MKYNIKNNNNGNNRRVRNHYYMANNRNDGNIKVNPKYLQQSSFLPQPLPLIQQMPRHQYIQNPMVQQFQTQNSNPFIYQSQPLLQPFQMY